MKLLVALLALAAGQAAPPSFVATTLEDAGGVRLHVGDTGIRCVRLPCPARGVFTPGEGGAATRDQLAYVDLDGLTPPPPMIGAEADLSDIRDAWDERRCAAILGRLIPGEEDRPVLRVDRVLGPCWKE